MIDVLFGLFFAKGHALNVPKVVGSDGQRTVLNDSGVRVKEFRPATVQDVLWKIVVGQELLVIPLKVPEIRGLRDVMSQWPWQLLIGTEQRVGFIEQPQDPLRPGPVHARMERPIAVETERRIPVKLPLPL